jgi:FHA domain
MEAVAMSSGTKATPTLVVTSDGPLCGMVMALDGAEITVGRHPSADVWLDHPEISGIHARLRRSPSGLSVQDLGSSAGTSVNGIRLVGPCRVRDGDFISFATVQTRHHAGLRLVPTIARFDAGAALEQVAALRDELRHLPLDRPVTTGTRRELDQIQVELTKSEPDRRRAAARLERLTRVLSRVGALSTDAASPGPPIAALAGMLGVQGEPVRQLLTS